MNYFIQRDGQQYGPYSLADLQRYVASGNIQITDLARGENGGNWIPVSQILGNAGATPPPSAQAPVPPYGSVPQVVPANAPGLDLPPDLHWAILLIIGFFCGLVTLVMAFIQASKVRKMVPGNNALLFYGLGLVLVFGSLLATPFGSHDSPNGIAILAILAGVAVLIAGHFTLKSGMEQYFNSVVPLNLRLSGVMTFFFNTIYFQYHFNRIHRWKNTGVLM